MEKEEKKNEKRESKTGKYKYDKKLGKVVKVSDDVVGLKKGGSSSDQGSSCGPGGCCCCG